MLNMDWPDHRKQIAEEIKALDLPIFIWGGCSYGHVVADYLRENNIKNPVTYVVDDEYSKPGDGFMPLSEYLERYAENSVMIIGFGGFEARKRKKEQYKEIIKHLYDFNIALDNNEWYPWNFERALANRERYNMTYNMLADSKSKKNMEYFLEAAISGTDEAANKLYTECFEPQQYFVDFVRESPVEALVDCGAYDGDTIHEFVKYFPSYKKAYALEPDPANIKALRKRIRDENIRDIMVVPKGVYKESTTLHFALTGNTESHTIASGGVELPVAALDELLAERSDKLMIKMDIEGNELDALKGSSRTIAAHHPVLAICVYHKNDDLITIPQYIRSLVGEDVYDYYLRFHGRWMNELVLYAIPREEQ